MSMNVSINILFVAHSRQNMLQLLGRKFFRQFFHLPLSYKPVMVFSFSVHRDMTHLSSLWFIHLFGYFSCEALKFILCFIHFWGAVLCWNILSVSLR